MRYCQGAAGGISDRSEKSPVIPYESPGFFDVTDVAATLLKSRSRFTPQGLEPRQTEPESVVLPLHHGVMNRLPEGSHPQTHPALVQH